MNLPEHLKKHVGTQDYESYTPVDQSVWRYCVRQLRHYLSTHGHPLYLEGLEKTGIDTEKIPNIQTMSEKLGSFGWSAVPVSGFIPPAAFMEMQSLGILPIAADIRSREHILYTPAPDIVHEAAGHAPILVDPKFANYLKSYANVAKKAIISHEDIAQYEAIRELSDLKEDPQATDEQIQAAEAQLEAVNKSMSFVSEASWLSRMNWWTAEYGLIGSLENPKIYGAGLLSSVGEARSCLSENVEKIPLTVDCVKQTYDITEPQPQLFVTPNFEHLSSVLDQLAEKMAFRRGGRYGLDRAIEAQTICTSQLESGIQISGKHVTALYNEKDQPIFIKTEGATQLSLENIELDGHGKAVHEHGYSTPLGPVVDLGDLHGKTAEELETLGLVIGASVELEYVSGFQLKGTITDFFPANDHVLLIRFRDCLVTYQGDTFFDPTWGVFDLALGGHVDSVFAGPADRKNFGHEEEGFASKQVAKRDYDGKELQRHHLYAEIRKMRESGTTDKEKVIDIIESADRDFSEDWLLYLEIFELSKLGLMGAELEPTAQIERLQKVFPELSEGVKMVTHATTT